MEGTVPEGARILNSWHSLTKNAEGEAEIHTLHKFDTPSEDGPDYVRQAPPNIINSVPRRRSRKVKEQLTLVGGDAQLEYGDPVAMANFQRAVQELQPDTVAFVGDMVDFPALSKYPQRQEWVGSTQRGIDAYSAYLAQTRANAPNARIVVVHGNHEQRAINFVERQANELSGLRRAMGGRAVLSLAFLARYDELEVESVDGYPNGTYWLEDNLKLVHGTNTKTGGSNAARYLATEMETTIYGHTHRQELAFKTRATRLGGITIAAASPGALCASDGSVPGVHYSPDAEGNVVKKAENWQSGLLLVHHEGLHHEITPVRFTDRGFLLNGKRYANEAG